jgi:hypothetical protein
MRRDDLSDLITRTMFIIAILIIVFADADRDRTIASLQHDIHILQEGSTTSKEGPSPQQKGCP